MDNQVFEYINRVSGYQVEKHTENFTMQVQSQIMIATDYYLTVLLEYVGMDMETFTYNMNYEHDFSLTGSIGGQVVYSGKYPRIRWNMYIAERNVKDYIYQTVAHEVAHLVVRACQSAKFANYRGKVQSHGWQWQKLMMAINRTPKRCHNYETVRGKSSTKWQYKGECGCILSLSTVRHNRQQTGKTNYVCGKHKKRLVWTGKNTVLEAGTLR